MEHTGMKMVSLAKRLAMLKREYDSTNQALAHALTTSGETYADQWETQKQNICRRSEKAFERLEAEYKRNTSKLDAEPGDARNHQAGRAEKLQKIRHMAALVQQTNKGIPHRAEWEKLKRNPVPPMTLEELLEGKVDFLGLLSQGITLYRQGKTKAALRSFAQLDTLCYCAEEVLSTEIRFPQAEMAGYQLGAMESMEKQETTRVEKEKDGLKSLLQAYQEQTEKVVELDRQPPVKEKEEKAYYQGKFEEHLSRIYDAFLSQFPPMDLREDYLLAVEGEPDWRYISYPATVPEQMCLGRLEYSLTGMDLDERLENFLERYYPFLCRSDKLSMPWLLKGGTQAGWSIAFRDKNREQVSEIACNLAIRMMLLCPPGKMHFTFGDSVMLGENFATITRLLGDEAQKVYGRKIWSDPANLERSLQQLTNHIADVTQRCLQGRFADLVEYNQSGEGEPEGYQVLMLMDYPVGMTGKSLELLEQIFRSGPRCGVIPFLFVSESGMKKCSTELKERAKALADQLIPMVVTGEDNLLGLKGMAACGRNLQLRLMSPPEEEKLMQRLDSWKLGL